MRHFFPFALFLFLVGCGGGGSRDEGPIPLTPTGSFSIVADPGYNGPSRTVYGVGQTDLAGGTLTIGGFSYDDSRETIQMDLAGYRARKGVRYPITAGSETALRLTNTEGRAWVATDGALVDGGKARGGRRIVRLVDVSIVPVPYTGAYGAATLDGEFEFPFSD